MKLRDYIIRRLLLAIPVVIGVLAITFVLSYVVGNPITLYTTERTRPEAIPGIIAEHGLDKPIYIQFFYYLWDLLQGNWGYSRTARMDVTEAISWKLPATIELAMVAMVFAIIVGIPLGIISATRKDKVPDHVTRVLALAGVSMPIFWFALIMKYVLYYQFFMWGLPYLPEGGRYSYEYIPYTPLTNFVLFDSLITGNFLLFFDALIHLVLPGFALGYLTLAIITRMMRSSMLEVLKEDYITLARSKGLTERVVIYKHALRNAMIPTVTVIGLAFGSLMTGAVLTETIFSWPGLGRWSTRAILTSDIPSINAFTLLVAFIFVGANLIVDLVYGALDPRIRYG
ncbi:MAG: ABC transporter permease [Candidatus Thorarchaeota archaeon]|nr:MAG: ABC transporter permease [Candidatus Thorarchaeota archaeon]RLI55727.1 MAG: ABC transporter permease [Candidatus Thorarchaeota archaeon]